MLNKSRCKHRTFRIRAIWMMSAKHQAIETVCYMKRQCSIILPILWVSHEHSTIPSDPKWIRIGITRLLPVSCVKAEYTLCSHFAFDKHMDRQSASGTRIRIDDCYLCRQAAYHYYLQEPRIQTRANQLNTHHH